MPRWRLDLHGSLRVERDGTPHRLRTRHQAFLLLRLAASGPRGVDRAETAALLWPEAERPHRAAYLRRALMELRQSGVEIEAEGDRLRLPLGHLEIDTPPNGPILPDLDHPIAEETRAALAQPSREIATTDGDRLLAWVGEALLRDHPDVALEILAANGMELLRDVPPGPMLRLFLRALSTGTRAGRARVQVLSSASMAAMYLTRYGLAERLATLSVEECRALDDPALLAHLLAILAFFQMERRRWSEAIETGEAAVRTALEAGDPRIVAIAHVSLGAIQWHTLRLDEALASYARAESATVEPGYRQVVRGNVALIQGLFGLKAVHPVEPPTAPFSAGGSQALAEANLRVGYGLAHHRPDLIREGAARLLRVAGEAGMERIFSLALDHAAYAFARSGLPADAAACLRLGSRLRFALGHRRSPAERKAVRLHVAKPYFGPEIAAAMAGLDVADPAACGRRLAGRLEILGR